MVHGPDMYLPGVQTLVVKVNSFCSRIAQTDDVAKVFGTHTLFLQLFPNLAYCTRHRSRTERVATRSKTMDRFRKNVIVLSLFILRPLSQ